MMKTIGIAVYGGSSSQVDSRYLEDARKLGQGIAQRGWQLVNGSGDTGIMGASIRGVLDENGTYTGIAPDFFQQPGVLFNEGLDTVFTRTMRERKAFMESLSDAFVTCPGGIGTLEEFYEILTLKQLGQLHKPLILFNDLGYYDSLLAAMEDMRKAGFIHDSVMDLFEVKNTVEEVLKALDDELKITVHEIV